MKANKALKELKKKSVHKLKSKSLEQLNALKMVHSFSNEKRTDGGRGKLSSELNDVANEAALSALSELAAPLSPIFSWLNGNGQGSWTGHSNNISKRVLGKTSVNKSAPKISSIATLPLKSPPCKRCPALSNGICKCAAKKFKLSA